MRQSLLLLLTHSSHFYRTTTTVDHSSHLFCDLAVSSCWCAVLVKRVGCVVVVVVVVASVGLLESERIQVRAYIRDLLVLCCASAFDCDVPSHFVRTVVRSRFRRVFRPRQNARSVVCPSVVVRRFRFEQVLRACVCTCVNICERVCACLCVCLDGVASECGKIDPLCFAHGYKNASANSHHIGIPELNTHSTPGQCKYDSQLNIQ